MQKNQMILDESVKMDSKDDRIKMDDWGNTLIFSLDTWKKACCKLLGEGFMLLNDE